MSRRLKLEAWLHTRREAWRAAFVRGPATGFLFEFVSFGVKQAWACLFGGLMLALLVGSFLFYPANAPLARYDFLTLAALGLQAAMLAARLETWGEARVIFAFHVVGTLLDQEVDLQLLAVGARGFDALLDQGHQAQNLPLLAT